MHDVPLAYHFVSYFGYFVILPWDILTFENYMLVLDFGVVGIEARKLQCVTAFISLMRRGQNRLVSVDGEIVFGSRLMLVAHTEFLFH